MKINRAPHSRTYGTYGKRLDIPSVIMLGGPNVWNFLWARICEAFITGVK